MTLLNIEKYSKHPEVKEYVSALSGGQEPFFSSITINWRGAVAPQTAVDLKTLGFTLRMLKLLSVIVCEQSAIIVANINSYWHLGCRGLFRASLSLSFKTKDIKIQHSNRKYFFGGILPMTSLPLDGVAG